MVAVEAGVGSRDWPIEYDQRRGKGIFGKQERKGEGSLTCQAFNAHAGSHKNQELSPSLPAAHRITANEH